MKKIITLSFIFAICKLIAQPVGWMYNLPIQVQNNNTVNAVNYQLKIVVNTQNLISNGQMLANGNDLRFSDGCTSSNFFNYWIEGGLNTPTTAIWVKIPLIAANTSSTVFMFYGNSSAAAASAINGTFRGPNSATDSVTGGTSGGLTQCQRGFRFAPTQNMLVTHFGKNEPSGTTRYVTLFNYATQAVLSQTQVAGPSATYSYGPISNPIWLTSGTQYVLQIYGLSTDGYYFGTSSQIGQHLTYYDMQYSNGGTQNTFPNSVLANYHYGYGDFWYYITNTLTTIPSYTMGASNVSIISPSNAICSGNSMTLSTNATGSYTWSNGALTPSIVVSPTATTVYSVAQTGTSGCTSNAFLTLNVSGGVPVLSVISSTNQTCLGKTATLTASGALTYTWSNSVTNGVSFSPSVTTTYTVSGQNGCGTTTAVTTISVAPIAVNMLVTPTLVCAGKPATINVAAAATSYTWLPLNISGSSNSLIVSPQVNTTYTTVVSDGTCSGIGIISLATNPNPTITVSATSTTVCQGDPVTITASGGLNYTWTPGNLSGASITVNPTSPTAYVTTADNSFGCTSSTTQVIITAASPTVVLSANTNFICVGDPVTITASGATTYLWNSGSTNTLLTLNPTSSGTYSCTGTASNCSSTQTIDVAVFDPTLSITGSASLCEGVTSTLAVSGGGTYTWSTGSNFANTNITPTSTSVYTVSALTSSGSITCPSTASFQVVVKPNPTVTVVASRTVMCKGETIDLTASGASNYVWSNTTTTSNSIVVTSSLITTLNYTVTGTNTQGCSTSTTVLIKVNSCNAIKESTNGGNQLSIYPNPNSGNFTIAYASAIELNLVNELGQLVKTISLNSTNNFQASVSNLAKGIYFVTGQKSNTPINQKLIVN